jgi:hypothetical protein
LFQIAQLGIDREAVDLQWRDDLVWKPFETLEVMSKARLQMKWMLKTPRNTYQEWPRITDIDTVAQGSLRAHWHNRGVEKPPEREVSAWPSFLASYTANDATPVAPSASASFKAMTSAETESVAVAGGMPLPRSLAHATGRRQAAILLAATKGRPLKLRCCPKPGHEASFAASFSMDFEADMAGQKKKGKGTGGKYFAAIVDLAAKKNNEDRATGDLGSPGRGGSRSTMGLGSPGGGGFGTSASGFLADGGSLASGSRSIRDPFTELSRASRKSSRASMRNYNIRQSVNQSGSVSVVS